VQIGGTTYTLGNIQANHIVEVTFTFGLSCSFGLNPASASHGLGSETGAFDVWVQGGCSWTAITDDSWIHTSSSGNGMGTVNYTVDANPGRSSRSGTILVQGHAFGIS
jgi:methyl coenzyme M reductase beta subunit